METLKKHTLVYDSECPMCDLYTGAFVKTGMLDQNGRVEYGCARVPASFDNQKARDQIALIDYENGTVVYGLDSLLTIVLYNFPWLRPVVQATLVKWPLSKLYNFISYNRKVIAPPKVFEKRGSCTPTYHIGYRVAYIVFAWLVTSLILAAYTPSLAPLVPQSSFYREFLICGGQILFQMVFVRLMTKDKLLHYIGNMMTVSLIGALLLLPMEVFVSIADPTAWVPLVWFALVVTFMLVIHSRRVKMLGIPWVASATWVAYRLILLWIILI